MTPDPLSDIVSKQYERWVYPQPILDLPGWLKSNWQWFDPSHSLRMFWPDREYWPGMEILVAGCGTNQAAVLAYTNPDAFIVAVDVSQSSLNHHAYLKQKYDLKNLEIHHLQIESIEQIGREFDLIISTGVLHHLADPSEGLNSLARCLRRDGVMALMLYARYGRLGVEMLQTVFREMGLAQNDLSIAVVKDALASLPDDHPVNSYLKMAPDLAFDSGLVDTFLHGRERSYSIDECIEFVEQSGLVFQDIFLKSPYYAPRNRNAGFMSDVAALPERRQWSVMERVNFRNGCHFFTACRPDRSPQTYRIDFSSEFSGSFVPEFRHRCRFDGESVSRPGWTLKLDQIEAAAVRGIDGIRTIDEINKKSKSKNKNNKTNKNELFEFLWRKDFISIKFQ